MKILYHGKWNSLSVRRLFTVESLKIRGCWPEGLETPSSLGYLSWKIRYIPCLGTSLWCWARGEEMGKVTFLLHIQETKIFRREMVCVCFNKQNKTIETENNKRPKRIKSTIR